MAVQFTEFVTTQANLLADIRAAILANPDWTRPNAAGKPSLYKCTTTRGADMIVDFEDSAATLLSLVMAVYTSHDGTTGVGKSQRWLYFRGTAGVTTMPLYVVLSISKDHLFISVEGPRSTDPNTTSTTYGSVRNYFFICDLVPYHAGDTTPVVVTGGHSVAVPYASVTSNDHQVYISKSKTGIPWDQAKIATIDFPSMFTTDTIQTQRQCAYDSNYYLFPYVVVSDGDGIRGRLANIFFAGYNQTSDAPEVPTPAVQAKVSYNSQWYKLIAANKHDGTSGGNNTWGPLGATANTGASSSRSVAVAVPVP